MQSNSKQRSIVFVLIGLISLVSFLNSTMPAEAQSSVVGTWNAPQPLLIDGVHGAVLPSGKVLYLPHRDSPLGESVLFDPDQPGEAQYLSAPENFFCGGHTMLADGKLLFNGGETAAPNPLRASAYFDFQTENWTSLLYMNRPRWYPSTIQLGDGSVWTFGGQSTPANPDDNDPTIEIYDPASGIWVMAGGQDIPGQHEEAYNRLHLLPDGKIFQSGHLPDTYLYDPIAGTFTFVDTTNLNKPRGDGGSVRLQDGRILIVGGHDEIDSFASTEIIDLTQATPQWQNRASMTTARAFIDAIVLPDGNVLVVGGDEELEGRALVPELYDPVANTWTDMAPFTIHRGYHSTTLLLPDGRVIIGGGEGHDGPGTYGESGMYEIWNPYYLFSTSRPAILSLPTEAGYGGQLTMNYRSTVSASHVVIYRGGSQTHSFAYNHISIPVNFDSDDGSQATFTIPDNPNLLPPSYYMVFLMSADGVPSIARWVRIGGDVSGGEVIFSDGFESGDLSAWL